MKKASCRHDSERRSRNAVEGARESLHDPTAEQPSRIHHLTGLALLRALHITVRVLAWSLIGLGLALVLVMVRLDAGPLRLDWLKPRIEQALMPDNGRIVASAGGIELRLNKGDRTLELVGVDVRYRIDAQEETRAASFLAFPEVQLALSVEALLKRGMIAASEVKAQAPSLIITRSEDGVIGLRSETGDDDRLDDVDFGAFLYRFAQAHDAGDRIAFLNKLQIGGGRVAFYDRTRATALTAEDADLVLTRRDGGVEGWLRANMLQKTAGPVSLQISGRLEAGADRVTFEADVADLMPADLPALWPLQSSPIPADVAGMRLPVRASIGGEIGLDGGLSPMSIDIRASAGVVDLPAYLAEPLEVSAALLKGTLAGDHAALDIDRLKIADRGGAEVSGSGSIAWRENALALGLDLAVSDVRAEDLPTFWPPSLGVKSRKWVLENIKRGRVSEGEVKLDLKPNDWGRRPLRRDALKGMFAFEGLSVRYVDEMPPLEEASGTASFNADRMEFDAETGQNAGLTLNGGSVVITGMGKPGRDTTHLHVLADVEGSIEEALSVLDHPPLEVAKELKIAPAQTAGRVTTSIDLRMPLHGDVTAKEVVVLAEAELIDLSIERLPKLDGDIGLDQGAFQLLVDEEAVRLDGTAAVNDIPLAIDIYQPREDETAKRRIGLAGRLSGQQLLSQGMFTDGLDGDLGFEATVTETDSHFWIDFEADLAALALAPPGLAWEKPAAQPGVLYASVAVPIEQGLIEVKTFDIEAGDLKASGSLTLSPTNDGLDGLTLDVFRLAGTDAVIRVSPDGEGGFLVVIEAARLDLDALFGDDHEIGD
ncbi:MAG: DUF3971 domain-containing protein, partial [Alphaproteobacteria bacterium]|nr:DUF3971 domain-containing protein [Alphaproteobacteria bacterium]